MTGELHHVLTRVALGRGQIDTHSLVYQRSGIRLPQVTVNNVMVLQPAAEDPPRNGERLRAAHPHDPQRALAQRGSRSQQ